MVKSNYNIIEFKNINKTYPGVKAIDNVSFGIKAGKVHAIVGENGAGKSTIMSILAGIIQPDSGEVYFSGKILKLSNPRDALLNGIAMIYQEINLIQEMTVEENLFLGREFCNKLRILRKRQLLKSAKSLFDELNFNINPREKIYMLSLAEKQMVEIARAVSYDAEIIIMDEPTSAITEKEIRILFKLINDLKSKGKTIIYISHKLDEVIEIADTVTVLRDGCEVFTRPINEIDKQTIIKAMIGRELNEMYVKKKTHIEEKIVELKDLSIENRLENINFYVRKGEILGIAGLAGAGRTEIAEAIFGLKKFNSGEIIINNKREPIETPSKAISNKISFITEDRKLCGLNLKGSVKNNITLVSLRDFTYLSQIINFNKENKAADMQIKKFDIKTPSRNTIVHSLSGGNQQKVVVANWLLSNPSIIIMDEPTRGIDVGAKNEIYKIITGLAIQGKAIIMISSEIEELIGMSDRIIVLYMGKIVGEFNREEFNREKIISCITGHYERCSD